MSRLFGDEWNRLWTEARKPVEEVAEAELSPAMRQVAEEFDATLHRGMVVWGVVRSGDFRAVVRGTVATLDAVEVAITLPEDVSDAGQVVYRKGEKLWLPRPSSPEWSMSFGVQPVGGLTRERLGEG